jgi:hypothetical protein
MKMKYKLESNGLVMETIPKKLKKKGKLFLAAIVYIFNIFYGITLITAIPSQFLLPERETIGATISERTKRAEMKERKSFVQTLTQSTVLQSDVENQNVQDTALTAYDIPSTSKETDISVLKKL